MPGRKIDRAHAQERALTAIAAGNTRRAAAAYAGISDETLSRWEKSDVDFAAAIKVKKAESEVRLVSIIAKAAVKQWQAAAWLLERHPETKLDWKRLDELNLRNLTVDQLLELERACSARVESAGDRLAIAGDRED